MLKPIDFGYPISASRYTDIPTFHMKWVFEKLDRGWVEAPHPDTGMPAVWSMLPSEVHSIVWWSKNYSKFLLHPRRKDLDIYPKFFNMSISGDRGTELSVPPLEKQLNCFSEMVYIYGHKKLRWRYSPIPRDFSKFEGIVSFLSNLGITECYYSFLSHEGSGIPEWRSIEEKREILSKIANVAAFYDVKMFGCWDDTQFVDIPNVYEATCLDATLIDDLYGLSGLHTQESGCRCHKSIDIGNQILLPCHHHCTYCYASR